MENPKRRNFLTGAIGGIIGAASIEGAKDLLSNSQNSKESKPPRDITQYLSGKLGVEITHEKIKEIIDSLQAQNQIEGMGGVEILKGHNHNCEAYVSLKKGMDGLLRLHVEFIKREEEVFQLPPPRTGPIPKRFSF